MGVVGCGELKIALHAYTMNWSADDIDFCEVITSMPYVNECIFHGEQIARQVDEVKMKMRNSYTMLYAYINLFLFLTLLCYTAFALFKYVYAIN